MLDAEGYKQRPILPTFGLVNKNKQSFSGKTTEYTPQFAASNLKINRTSTEVWVNSEKEFYNS